jgi:hypothetical protein
MISARLPGAVRAAGVGSQFQGGASCLLETRGIHRGSLDDWEKESEKFTTQRATEIAAMDFRSPLASMAQSN